MNKLYIMLLVTFLNGCSAYIYNATFEHAKDLCKINGGLKYIEKDIFGGVSRATCHNTAKFNLGNKSEE